MNKSFFKQSEHFINICFLCINVLYHIKICYLFLLLKTDTHAAKDVDRLGTVGPRTLHEEKY